MRKQILAFMILFLLLGSSAQAADKDDALQALNDFYQTAMNEDLEGYIATQDQIYLDLITEEGLDYRDYYSAAFELTDVLDNTLSIQEVEIEGDRALVFYNVKGSAIISETGETKNIDNDMAAFLWRYPEGWKVRWTITQSLYQYKIESEMLAGTAAELTLSELDETSLRDEMVSEGLISVNDILVEPNDASNSALSNDLTSDSGGLDNEDAKDNPEDSKSSSIFKLIVVVLLLVAAYFVYRKLH